MTGLINPLTFEEFAKQMNILQTEMEQQSDVTPDNQTNPDNHNSIFNQIDTDINNINKMIRNIQEIKQKTLDHISESSQIINSVTIKGGSIFSKIKNMTINKSKPNSQKEDIPPKSFKKTKLKMFPSETISIPTQMTTMDEYNAFIDLIYRVLIDQYNNLLLVLTQLNDHRLNKILNKTYPTDIIRFHELLKHVKDVKDPYQVLDQSRIEMFAVFINGLASIQISEETVEKTDESSEFKQKGLFQYYLYIFRWIYAGWKIQTYKKMSELLKKIEEDKLKEPQKSNDDLLYYKEEQLFKSRQSQHDMKKKKLDEFIKKEYANYENPEYEVYKDYEKYKTLVDTYPYPKLYEYLKQICGSDEINPPEQPETNPPEQSEINSLQTDNMTTPSTKSSLNKMADKAMKEAQKQQDKHDAIHGIQRGGKKNRTRKWYKFQKRAIRNTIKYLRYREKKDK